jgi:hypothetical protein
MTKKFKHADGTETVVTTPTFWQKNQKTILIIGAVVIAGLVFLPDGYIKKYLPWVK